MQDNDTTTQPDTFDTDRREGTREPADGQVSATFYGPEGLIRLTSIGLIDISMTGIGASSAYEFAPGTRFILDATNTKLPAESGTVVRCIEGAKSFRLGLSYDRSLVA